MAHRPLRCTRSFRWMRFMRVSFYPICVWAPFSHIALDQLTMHNPSSNSSSVAASSLPFRPQEQILFKCSDLTCRFGAICQEDDRFGAHCICPFNCSDEISNHVVEHIERDEVCGSDLVMYPTTCHMLRRACDSRQEIVPRPKQLCQGLHQSPPRTPPQARFLLCSTLAFRHRKSKSFLKRDWESWSADGGEFFVFFISVIEQSPPNQQPTSDPQRQREKGGRFE